MDHRVQLIIALMKDNLRQELLVGDMAQSVHLSASRFHYLFKAETGRTPAQYYHSLRIQKARDLLATSLLSVRQIRCRVGVKDRSHFEREFKKAHGLTPIQYRIAIFSSVEKR